MVFCLNWPLRGVLTCFGRTKFLFVFWMYRSSQVGSGSLFFLIPGRLKRVFFRGFANVGSGLLGFLAFFFGF